MIYLLDTDHVSEFQAPSEAGLRLRTRLRQVAPDDYGTSIITFEEQMRGRLAKIGASGRTVSESVAMYALLNFSLRFYNNIAVWQYTEAAAEQFETLQQAKIRVGSQDLKIASIALTEEAMLLTRNTRDFAKVPDLLFEDWMA